jgi:hypothetical protein
MNKEEARILLAEHFKPYLDRSYEDLLYLLDSQDILEITSASGTFQAFWDYEEGGNLRVTGCIDDGGIRAFCPLTYDFIIAPDGTFMGEL